jgi:hypothetical protein
MVLGVWDASPIVLDLNGSGRIDTAKNEWRPHAPTFYKEYASNFDLTGDGQKDLCEWFKPGTKDGLLCIPENGEVRNALQLFGTAGGYNDGYEKLSIICDKDKNGWVEGSELEGLMLWVDSNHDGICQPDEQHSLSEFGVKRISAKHNNYVSVYDTTDGNTHKTWDWWPSMMEVIRKFK